MSIDNINIRQTGNKTTLYSVAHLLAAAILFLFALLHFAFLTYPTVASNPSLDLQNPVFPILANKHVYLLAGWFEATIGVCCLRLRGRDATNILILTFVGVILWYRWSFDFVGGTQCSCLGILGKLLHLTKYQEQVLPVIALAVLTMTTLPWLIRILWNSRKRVPSTLPLILALCVGVLFWSPF